MTPDRDTYIAQALDLVAVDSERDPDRILERARAEAVGLRRRQATRIRRTAIVAFAALLLLAGAAIAASRFDPLHLLDRSDRSSASFSVDSSRHYRGPAARVLNCPRAGKGTFDCSAGTLESSGRRSYQFADRVEAQPTLTRAYLLDQLAKAEQSHQIDHAAAERIQRNIADSGDDFFAALSGAITVSTIGGAEQAPGRPGFILVPPAGVPAWISCVAHGSAFRCRNLASSSGVAVGTPIYFLPSSPDWVAVPGKPGMKTTNIERYFREALGRNLRPAEQRLLIVLLTAGSGSGQTGTSPPQPTPR